MKNLLPNASFELDFGQAKHEWVKYNPGEGAGDNWTGRLVMNAPLGSVDSFDFYHQKTPEFGWREISSVRSAISILTYMREGRVMTLQIRNNTLRGSEITATVTPEKPTATFAAPRREPVRAQPSGAPPMPGAMPKR